MIVNKVAIWCKVIIKPKSRRKMFKRMNVGEKVAKKKIMLKAINLLFGVLKHSWQIFRIKKISVYGLKHMLTHTHILHNWCIQAVCVVCRRMEICESHNSFFKYNCSSGSYKIDQYIFHLELQKFWWIFEWMYGENGVKYMPLERWSKNKKKNWKCNQTQLQMLTPHVHKNMKGISLDKQLTRANKIISYFVYRIEKKVIWLYAWIEIKWWQHFAGNKCVWIS